MPGLSLAACLQGDPHCSCAVYSPKPLPVHPLAQCWHPQGLVAEVASPLGTRSRRRLRPLGSLGSPSLLGPGMTWSHC